MFNYNAVICPNLNPILDPPLQCAIFLEDQCTKLTLAPQYPAFTY